MCVVLSRLSHTLEETDTNAIYIVIAYAMDCSAVDVDWLRHRLTHFRVDRYCE